MHIIIFDRILSIFSITVTILALGEVIIHQGEIKPGYFISLGFVSLCGWIIVLINTFKKKS